jgi:hypothetical protein
MRISTKILQEGLILGLELLPSVVAVGLPSRLRERTKAGKRPL